MTQQPQVALQPGRPLNRAVAIVDAALSPIVQTVCWILLKAGVRLVLCDPDLKSVNELAEVYNLCMGCDPNYMDEPKDGWGSLRAIPAEVDGLTSHTADSLVTMAVREFERSPDVVVDVFGSLSSDFLWAVSNSCVSKNADETKSQITTVRPFSHFQLLTHGAHGPSEKDIQLTSSDKKHPCLHVLCGSDMVAKVRGESGRTHKPLHRQKSAAVVLSNDPISLISYIISGGAWCPNLKLVDSTEGTSTFSELVMSRDIGNYKSEVTDDEIVSTHQNSRIAHPGLSEETKERLDEEMKIQQITRRPGARIQFKPPVEKSVVTHLYQDRGEEITVKQQALSVLDCRCQYQIVQELVRGGVSWLVLCYILVMVTIPRLFGGSYI